MAERLQCYVASPYGFAESTREWYNQTFLPLINKHVEPIDPWSVDVSSILSAPADEQPDKWLDLGDHHFDTIKGVDLVVAGLDQEPPDGGTVGEVCFAAALNIPIIGYRGDLRTTGEEGLPYNLMIGAAIRGTGGLAVSSLVELDDALRVRAAEHAFAMNPDATPRNA